jgi:hypothetical protein
MKWIVMNTKLPLPWYLMYGRMNDKNHSVFFLLNEAGESGRTDVTCGQVGQKLGKWWHCSATA